MHLESDHYIWQGWPGESTYGCARAFGDRKEDLDVNFTGLPRSEVVTAVLVRCLQPSEGTWSGDDVWSWTLAQRLQGLLAITITHASRVPALVLMHSCGGCAESLEINVEPGMFERQETVTDFTWSPEPAITLRIALPTGREQRDWSRSSALSPRAIGHALVREIDGAAPSSEWEMPEEWIDGLAEELEQRDPLTALEIEAACPQCNTPARIALDLEAALLARLHTCQRQTLIDIHRLASAYHWSEARILELPAWRRGYYLAQLGAAGGR